MFEENGKAVQVHPLTLDHYLYDESYATADLIVVPNNRSRDINEAQNHVMAESLHNYN